MNTENTTAALAIIPTLEIPTIYGISNDVADRLTAAFEPFHTDAQTLVASCAKIVVTDAGQKLEMKQARDARLALKKVRTSMEATRKSQKAGVLALGKAIDGVAGIILSLIEPEETRMEEAETFAQRAEETRKAALLSSRAAQLAGLTIDAGISLADISDETFAKLLADTQAAEAARVSAAAAEAAAHAEKERLEREALALAAAENRRLNDELAAERRKADEAASVARKEAADKAHAERVAMMEREEKERLEALAARKAAAAPDADKLRAFADQVAALVVPTLSTEAGLVASALLTDYVARLAKAVRTEADKL